MVTPLHPAHSGPGTESNIVSPLPPLTLITGTGRLTNAFYHIKAGGDRCGTACQRRRGGYSDHNELSALVGEGMLEIRYTGPRGGQRWHATSRGRRAVAKALNLQNAI